MPQKGRDLVLCPPCVFRGRRYHGIQPELGRESLDTLPICHECLDGYHQCLYLAEQSLPWEYRDCERIVCPAFLF